MATNIYDCGIAGGVYAYDAQTGKLSKAVIKTQREIEQYEKEMKEAQELYEQNRANPSQPPRREPIVFGEQALEQIRLSMEQASQRKEQSMQTFALYNLREIYDYAGITTESPENYSDISETDKALMNLIGALNNDLGGGAAGAPQSIVVHFRVMGNGDDPFAASLAYSLQREAYINAYDDESLRKKIEEMDLPEGVDKEYLLNAAKAYGESWKNKLDKNFDTQIDGFLETDAERLYRVFVPTDAEGEDGADKISAFADSLRTMLKEAADISAKYIQEGYTGNVLDKIREESSFRLDVGDKSYTWDDIVNKLVKSNNIVWSKQPGGTEYYANTGQCRQASTKYEQQFAFVY